MGAWGTGLFSDDSASDVRDGYRDLIGDGYSSSQATDLLIAEWSDSLLDPEESSVFWLALASTQWQCGRLENRVKSRALEIIDSGTDLARWRDDPKQLKNREAVLAKLRSQILAPQPRLKRIPKRFRDSCDWSIGEVIGYRLQTGKWVLLLVVGFHSDKGGTSPICMLLDWLDESLPTMEIIFGLPAKESRFMIGRTKEKELPIDRIKRLGARDCPNAIPGLIAVYLWSFLDEQIESILTTK